MLVGVSATGSAPSSQTLTYNAADQITTTGYSYDGAGNLTASPALGTATYNAARQLTADTTPAAGNGTYSYAGSDQTELVSQTVPGGASVSYCYGRTNSYGLPIVESVTKTLATKVHVAEVAGVLLDEVSEDPT